MKKLVAGTILFSFAVAAFAACPVTAPYRCAIWGGKVICGCGL